MKILNIDSLAASPTRFLTMRGIDYPIVPMTVENFVATTNAVNALVAKEDATAVDQVMATIDMICRSVPTIPREALSGLDLEALRVIADFVRGEDVPQQTEKADEEEK